MVFGQKFSENSGFYIFNITNLYYLVAIKWDSIHQHREIWFKFFLNCFFCNQYEF